MGAQGTLRRKRRQRSSACPTPHRRSARRRTRRLASGRYVWPLCRPVPPCGSVPAVPRRPHHAAHTTPTPSAADPLLWACADGHAGTEARPGDRHTEGAQGGALGDWQTLCTCGHCAGLCLPVAVCLLCLAAHTMQHTPHSAHHTGSVQLTFGDTIAGIKGRHRGEATTSHNLDMGAEWERARTTSESSAIRTMLLKFPCFWQTEFRSHW